MIFKWLLNRLIHAVVKMTPMIRDHSPDSPTTANRIGVLAASGIGDAILLTPLIQDLRARHPQARIVVVCRAASRPLFDHMPHVNRVLSYSPATHTWRALLTLRGALKREHLQYWIAGYPTNTVFHSLITLVCGARIRIKHENMDETRFRDYDYLYTHLVPWNMNDHRLENNHRLLKVWPSKRGNKRFKPVLFIPFRDQNRISCALSCFPPPPYVVLHAGGTWPEKRWPVERFIEIGNLLIRHNISVILAGGNQDLEINEFISKKLESRRLCNTTGQLTLLQTAALLSRCQGLVCNDTALMHIADALHVSLVALFGYTSPVHTGPTQTRNRGIVTAERMDDINTETVWNEIKRVILHEYLPTILTD
jgi:heptosyltransferase-2